jgi:hypothetical protein
METGVRAIRRDRREGIEMLIKKLHLDKEILADQGNDEAATDAARFGRAIAITAYSISQ